MAEGHVTKRKSSTSGIGSSSGSERNGDTLTDSTGRSMLCRLKEKVDREETVLWRRPITTLHYFLRETSILVQSNGLKLWRHRISVFLCLTFAAACVVAYHSKGPHQQYVQTIQKKFIWCAYWVGLGVLSSVGLGTGLHTFLLYLGPHIASVTLAAYECDSLDFPSPPYPDEIICPENGTTSRLAAISMWDIMSKVRLEAFMWGAGTALGELPPYFMARAARLSGYDPEDEDLEEYEQVLRQQDGGGQSVLDKAKVVVQKLVEKVGFLGILACASIPNPLFDLAGITCGHFLVPFWTFFGATLIGKAVIKMHIQKMFVIIAFNEDMVASAVHKIKYVPYIGKYLQAPFKEFLVKQKAKLHRKAGTSMPSEGSWLSWVFEKFVIAMIVYFVLSIVNSLAQSYHKRIHKTKKDSASGTSTSEPSSPKITNLKVTNPKLAVD